MLRTTLTICLLFSCIAIGHATDANETNETTPAPRVDQAETLPNGWFQSSMPSVLKGGGTSATKSTLDSKVSPAVHVNSTGMENTYGSRKTTAAVDRLKSIRDTPLRPKPTAQPAAEKVQVTTTPKTTNRQIGSSRRPKAAELNSNLAVTPGNTGAPRVTAPGQPLQLDLPSVVTRRGSAEPTLAMPKAAAPPAKLPRSDFITAEIVEPKAGPKLTTPPPIEIPKTVQTAPLQVTPVFETAQPAALGFEVPSEVQVQPKPATPRIASLPQAAPSQRRAKPIRNESFSEVTISNGHTVESEAKIRPEPPVKPTIRKSKPQAKVAQTRKTPTAPKTQKKPTIADNQEGNELLSNRSPVLVVKTHGQTKIRVGRTATYYVTASNKGDMAAEDVVVDVNVPNWAELTRNQSSSGAVRVEPNLNGDNVLHWTIRDLKPGSSQRLQIDLIPRASRSIELGVTWNFKSVSAMAQIEVEEPKLQLSVVGPGDIRFGDTKLYSITVSNPGSGEAENVMLTLLPVNNNGGTAGEKDLGTIKAGTQRTIEVELTARQAGDLAIRAQASADGGLRAEAEQPVRVRRPNLVVEANGPQKRYAGTPARYTVKVTNTGDATARDIVATAGLPMGAQFIKSSQNGAFDKNRNLVQWTMGALRPGAYQLVEVTTVLNGAGPSRLDAKAAAKLDQLSASASAVTEVEALADLRLTVVDPVGPVPLDTEVAYEVRIENRGTKAANDINVVGYFSEGIEPVSVQGWQGDVQVGQVSLETIPQVSPGQRMVIKVMARATRSGNHVFRAELDSDDPATKTKLAVEEWTVFHEDNDLLLDPEDAPIQQAEKPADGGLLLEPVRR